MIFFIFYLSSGYLLGFGDAVGRDLTGAFSFGKGLSLETHVFGVNRCLAFHLVAISSEFLIHGDGHWSLQIL